MPNPFPFYPKLATVLADKPLWAVEALGYQAGPADFPDGKYIQVVDVSSDAVTAEYANELLAIFKALGYKGANSLTTKQGETIEYAIIPNPQKPTDDRDLYAFVQPGPGFAYDGLLSEYYSGQSEYNDVNGGGVGSPGAWTLPKGSPEPVWVPSVYTPTVAA